MTPDERSLLTAFLQDLSRARGAPKDPEADALITRALASNPDGAYLLVQHTILSDQALRAAQDRIADLEDQVRGMVQSRPTSFLGGGAPWGGGQGGTAVPQTAGVQSGGGPFSTGGGLGSFLRNAGTMAVGVAGGEMLFEGLSGLFGGRGGGFGGGYGQPVENVTINNYDDGGGNDGGWSDDNSGGGSDY